MSLKTCLLCLLGLLIGACTQVQTDNQDKPDVYADVEAEMAAESRPGAVDDQTRGVIEDVWTSPEFRRQLQLSNMPVTELEPSVTTTEQQTLMEVDALVAEDKKDEALAALLEARGQASTALFDFLIGMIYFEREQLDQAAKSFRVAVEKHPKFRRAWRNLGLIYMRESKFEQAIPALTRVVELGGGDGITYGLLGIAFQSVKDELAAESAYRQAILLEPDKLNWKRGILKAMLDQERYAEVASLSDYLLERNPEQAWLWKVQATAYLQMDKPMKAAENFEFLDGMGEAKVTDLQVLGNIYINAELYELAVNAYRRAIAMDQQRDKHSRAVQAARQLTYKGANAEAEALISGIQAAYKDVLADEDKIGLLRLEARLAAARGEGGEREAEILRQIVELDPKDGQALISLGNLAARDGRIEDAISWYEQAVLLADHEADALVRYAQLLMKQNRFDQAIAKLERAQQIRPRENVGEYLDQVRRYARTRPADAPASTPPSGGEGEPEAGGQADGQGDAAEARDDAGPDAAAEADGEGSA